MSALAALLFLLILAPAVEQYHASALQNTYQTAQNTAPPVTADDRIANYKFWLTVITGILAVIAMVQIWFLSRSDKTARISADAARDAGNAAIESNKINRAAMIADQRPWVTVDVKLRKPVSLDENGFNFNFEFICKNIGKTPALEVCIRFEVICEIGIDEVERQIQFSNSVREQKTFMGFTLFPTEDNLQHIGTSVSRAAIEPIARAWREKHGIDMNFITPTLMGCVCYKTAFDGTQRQTGFIMQIRQLGPNDEILVIGHSEGQLVNRPFCLVRGLKDGNTD